MTDTICRNSEKSLPIISLRWTCLQQSSNDWENRIRLQFCKKFTKKLETICSLELWETSGGCY